MVADLYMTTSQLAKYRGESERSARRFISSGKVPVYRDGSRPRVLKSEVDAYMQSCRIEAAPQPTTLKSMLETISAKALAARKAGATR